MNANELTPAAPPAPPEPRTCAPEPRGIEYDDDAGAASSALTTYGFTDVSCSSEEDTP